MTVEPLLSRYSEGFDLPVRGDVITTECWRMCRTAMIFPAAILAVK